MHSKGFFTFVRLLVSEMLSLQVTYSHITLDNAKRGADTELENCTVRKRARHGSSFNSAPPNTTHSNPTQLHQPHSTNQTPPTQHQQCNSTTNEPPQNQGIEKLNTNEFGIYIAHRSGIPKATSSNVAQPITSSKTEATITSATMESRATNFHSNT